MTQKEMKALIGKKMNCDGYGVVKVVELVEKSRTRIKVKDLYRGKGWDEKTQSYKGYKFRGSWVRGENGNYGLSMVVRIEDLTEIKN